MFGYLLGAGRGDEWRGREAMDGWMDGRLMEDVWIDIERTWGQVSFFRVNGGLMDKCVGEEV